jgi:hypothetical protein
LNVALAFYNVGTIWAHEVDIFRCWRLVPPDAFHRLQEVHWRKLPYWVLVPVGLALIGSISLVWYRPAHSPPWAPWSPAGCQIASHILTAMLWGRWQAKLSKDPLDRKSLPRQDRLHTLDTNAADQRIRFRPSRLGGPEYGVPVTRSGRAILICVAGCFVAPVVYIE